MMMLFWKGGRNIPVLLVLASVAILKSDALILKNRTLAENFDILCEMKFAGGKIDVWMARSKRTNLTVMGMIPQQRSAQTTVSHILGTPLSDDLGTPHVLEHAIGEGGTAEHPYYGVVISNILKGYNSMKDYSTAPRYTTYTMDSLGRQILDNADINTETILLTPLMKDSITTMGTFVDPITGKNTGSVFREMFNNPYGSHPQRMLYLMGDKVFKGSHTMYYNSGGDMEAMTESFDPQGVIDYHRKYYVPSNLNIIYEGKFTPDEILSRAYNSEDSFMPKFNGSTSFRTYTEPYPVLSEDIDFTKEYAALDKTEPCMSFFWITTPVTNVEKSLATVIFSYYLEKNYVKGILFKDDDRVKSVELQNIPDQIESTILKLEGVKVEDMDAVKEKFLTGLRSLSDDDNDVMDLELIKENIEFCRGYDHSNEDSGDILPHIHGLTFHLVFNSDCKAMEDGGNHPKFLDELLEKPISYWKNLIKELVVGKPIAVFRLIPSEKMKSDLEAKRAKLVDERVNDIGLDYFKKEQDRLVDSFVKKNNSVPVEAYNVNRRGDVDDIYYPDFTYYSNIKNYNYSGVKSLDDAGLERLPIKMNFIDDAESTSMRVKINLDLRSMPKELNIYSSLMCYLLNELSIEKEGKILSIKESKEIKDETLSSLKTRIGNSKACYNLQNYPYYITVETEVSYDSFDNGVKYISDLLFKNLITEEAVIESIDGITEAFFFNYYLKPLYFYYAHIGGVHLLKPGGVARESTLPRQKYFLENLKEIMTNESRVEEKEKVMNDLKMYMTTITDLNAVSVVQLGSLKTLKEKSDYINTWRRFAYRQKNRIPDFNMYPVEKDYYNAMMDLDEKYEGYIYAFDQKIGTTVFNGMNAPLLDYSMDSETLAFMLASLHTSYYNFHGPNNVDLRVRGLVYFTKDVYRAEKGTYDFAHGSSINASLTSGIAYENFKEMAAGKHNITEELLEVYKGTVIKETVPTLNTLKTQSMEQSLMHYSPTYMRGEIQKKLDQVTLEEANNALVKYMSRIIDPKQRITIVIGSKDTAEATRQEFERMNMKMKIIYDLKDSPLNQPDGKPKE